MKDIYIAKSKIAGRGIFANEDIRKGDFVTFMKGSLIRKEYRTKTDLRVGTCWVGFRHNWWVNPKFPILFTNHSCDANLGFKTARRVYAIRDIKKGEELTIDYSTIEEVEFWVVKCSCGARNCRKEIRSVQFLPKATFKHYLPYIPRYFRKVYLQYENKS